MDYSLNQLQAFVATVELGSFKAAARHINKSSQVVARFVSMMEDSCKVQLFDRQVRKLQVTEEGSKLYSYARRVLLEAEKLNQQLSAFDQKLPNSFSLGIDNMLASEAITNSCVAVVSEIPTIDLTVYSGSTLETLQRVRSGEVEVGVVFGPLLEFEGLTHISAFNFKMAEVAGAELVRPGEVLSESKQSSLTQVVPDFIIEHQLQSVYCQSDRIMVCNDLQETIRLLQAGAGWARLPAFQVQQQLSHRSLNEFIVEGATPLNWFASIYHKSNAELSLASDMLIEQVTRLDEKDLSKHKSIKG
ncbi:LysR family transcriptional regulator [Paraferrimonas haliotis]|uniref:LysR family transcriptional regulator n=1 Tax=Paraferrimonas haliotis TaxID=2013866 RepID=UPI0015CB93C3|nr:LysR family transcriptional regulator [Paraferrimonas haliotis]